MSGTARDAELEAALIANPGDRETYRVYGDWLESQGDPRGELVHLQLRAEDDRSSELHALVEATIERIEPALLGDLAQRVRSGRYAPRHVFTWRRGFIDHVRLERSHCAAPLARIVEELLAHPACTLLGSLELHGRIPYGEVITDHGADFAALVDVLANAAPRSVRRLWLAIPQNLANLPRLADLPGLAYLGIRLEDRDHGVMTPEVVRALGAAPWPRLRSIALDLGRNGAMPADLAPLLERTDLPLVGLVLDGDRRSTFCSEICRMLVASPHAATLERVSLSVGNLSHADYELLLANRARFARLRELDVPSRSYTKLFSAPPEG